MKFSDYIESSPASQLAKDNMGLRKPKRELKYNETAVNEFIVKMADPTKNNRAVIDLLTRKRVVIDEERYQGTIVDGLLNVSYLELPPNRQLKLTYGRVSTEEVWFRFYTQEAKAGNIEIFIPPVVFDEIDKNILHSVILHELQHAQDWIDPNWKRKMKLLSLSNKESKKDFNELLYIKTLRESRAWGRQLDDLMKSIGNSAKVLSILTHGNQMKQVMGAEGKPLAYAQPALVTLTPTLTEFAEEFLKNYTIKKENISSYFAGPLAAFGALSPQMPPTNPIPAIVKQDTSQQEVMAVNLIKKIHNAFHFRNFVKSA